MTELRRNAISLALCMLFVRVFAIAQGQQIPAPAAETHQFDPLLGKWKFWEHLNKPELPPKLLGEWTFRSGGDGLMAIDEFRVFNGVGKTAYLGETYRVYNPSTKKWDFQFTDFQFAGPGEAPKVVWTSGTSTALGDGLVDDTIKSGKITRGRIHSIRRDSFECEWEHSTDGGKTWASDGHLEAERVAE
jgi:hypothetical protein